MVENGECRNRTSRYKIRIVDLRINLYRNSRMVEQLELALTSDISLEPLALRVNLHPNSRIQDRLWTGGINQYNCLKWDWLVDFHVTHLLTIDAFCFNTVYNAFPLSCLPMLSS